MSAGHAGAADKLARRLCPAGVQVDVRDLLEVLLHDTGPAPRAHSPSELGEALWAQIRAGRGGRVLPDPIDAVLAVLPGATSAAGEPARVGIPA